MKPVRFPALEENATDAQLPADTKELYLRVWDIVVEHQQVMPLVIRREIQSLAGRKLAAHWFCDEDTAEEVTNMEAGAISPL